MSGFKTVDEAVQFFLSRLEKFEELHQRGSGKDVLKDLRQRGYYLVGGDAVSYNGNAILFVSDPDSGETGITQNFSRDGGVHLSESLTWIYAPDETQRPNVFNRKSGTPTSVPLEWIIYLTNPEESPKARLGVSPGSNKRTLNTMFGGYPNSVMRLISRTLRMTNVKMYNYNIPKEQHPLDTYREIKGFIGGWSKT